MQLSILSSYFMLIENEKALQLYFDTHSALPLLESAVNELIPYFLLSERRKTGNCKYTTDEKLEIDFLSVFFLLLW